jgi:hypothetical protein
VNAKIEELSKGLAVQVVAQKIADGALDVSGSQTFEDLAHKVETLILELAKGFGAKDKATPAKPERAPRKDARPANGGAKRSNIDPGALKGYIGASKEGAVSLQRIADHFGVSKGVAKRAVEALPGVKSATGENPSGKRGAPPVVYWTE